MKDLTFTKQMRYATLLVMINIVACAEPNISDENVQSLEKVINGQAEFGEPETVALGYGQNRRGGCTGTLIAPRTVLTAAHCIFTQDRGYQVPTVIGVSTNGSFNEVIEVIDYAMHPSWTGAVTDAALERGVDIAILYLAYSPSVRPIMVDRTPPQNRIGEVGKIVGFGRTDAMDKRSGGTKNSVNLRINGVVGSNRSLLELVSTDGMVRGSCHGDSGGPFFIGSGAQRVVSGVTSYGTSTCDGASIYVSTAFFATWINENLNQRTSGVRQANTRGNSSQQPAQQPAQQPGQQSGGSCLDLVYCIGGCNQNQTCAQDCGQRASTQAISAYNQIIDCANGWSCEGDVECVNRMCANEINACDPSLLQPVQQPAQDPGQQPAQQPAQQGSYSCGEMLTCMSQCYNDQCFADCYYGSDYEAQVEYETLITCANNMGCTTAECVDTYCGQQVQACFQ